MVDNSNMLRNRKTRRRLAATGSAALLLLTLSGCYRMDMSMTVNADETIDGIVTVAVSKDALEQTGASVENLIAADTIGDPEYIKSVEPYTKDDLVGKKFVLEGAPLDYFSTEGQDTITLKHVGDTYVLDGGMNLGPADDTSHMIDALLAGQGTIQFTFPGEVTETNGTLDEDSNTVAWTFEDLSQRLEMHAVAKDSPSSGVPVWLLGVGGAAALLIVVVVVVRLARAASAAAAAMDDYSPVSEVGAGPGSATFTEWATTLDQLDPPPPPRYEEI